MPSGHEDTGRARPVSVFGSLLEFLTVVRMIGYRVRVAVTVILVVRALGRMVEN